MRSAVASRNPRIGTQSEPMSFESIASIAATWNYYFRAGFLCDTHWLGLALSVVYR